MFQSKNNGRVPLDGTPTISTCTTATSLSSLAKSSLDLTSPLSSCPNMPTKDENLRYAEIAPLTINGEKNIDDYPTEILVSQPYNEGKYTISNQVHHINLLFGN